MSCNQVDEREQKQWCSANWVNGRAMRKAIDVHMQLSAQLASDQTVASSPAAANGNAQHSGGLRDPGGSSTAAETTTGLRRALTAGLAVHGAMRQPDGEIIHVSRNCFPVHVVHLPLVWCMQLPRACVGMMQTIY
jgi:hypothetical protein